MCKNNDSNFCLKINTPSNIIFSACEVDRKWNSLVFIFMIREQMTRDQMISTQLTGAGDQTTQTQTNEPKNNFYRYNTRPLFN
jgi:hypothetical protein